MTRPYVTIGRFNQGRERGINVLRELLGEKCRWVLEKYIRLVLIRSEILSTGE
jgi:hypothetical protein